MTVTMIIMMAVIMITMKMVTVDKQTNEQTTKQQQKNALHCVSGNTNKQSKGSEVFAAKFR